MTTESTAKKDTQKLQRAIVDGLEDVKAQDIRVFNTEAMSPLFERVVVASGTSNRQTRALSSSVRDKVREAGFPKPRIEGEENGEWIIVDCGPAVVHIMQPAIRQYYNLEEIWGEKPVRLKLAGAARKAASAKAAAGASEKASSKAGPVPDPAAKRGSRVVAEGGKGTKTTKATKTETPSGTKTRARAAAGASAPSPARAPAKASAKPAAKRPAARKAAGASAAGKAPARRKPAA